MPALWKMQRAISQWQPQVDNVTGHLNLVMSLFITGKGKPVLYQLRRFQPTSAEPGQGACIRRRRTVLGLHILLLEDKQDLPNSSDGYAYNESYTYTVGYLDDGGEWTLLSDSKVYDLNENGTGSNSLCCRSRRDHPAEDGVVVAKDKT